ncbi:MAG: hypothetical protein J6R59_02060 [Paludibacteraceae bacterium]|nr:hypothetical protein [Paludibacteraceae bacterium]
MSVLIKKWNAEDFFNDVAEGKFTSRSDEKFVNFLFRLIEDDEHEIEYSDFKQLVNDCYMYRDEMTWNLHDGASPETYLYYLGEIDEDDEITSEQRKEVVDRFKHWVNEALGLPFNGETFNEYTIRSLVEKAKQMGKVVLIDKNGDIAGIPFFNKR